MHTQFDKLISAALALSVALCAVAAAADSTAAANKWTGSQGRSYASIARLPDWSGTWAISRESMGKILALTTDPTNAEAPHMAPAQETQRRQVLAGSTKQGNEVVLVNDNAIQCLPHGMPLMMAVPAPIGYEFLFTPGRVTILNEEGEVRRIYTDGRRHGADPDPTYSGDAIGHWEGRTLVTDTVAIKPMALLTVAGVTGSGMTHVLERIRLKDKNTLEIETTVEDPIALTAPWHYHLTMERSPSGFIEYVCQENNREQGGELNLTPPE